MSEPLDRPPGIEPGVSVPKRFGHFDILGRIGHGGMGVVLDARTPDGRQVALKLIRPSGDTDRMKVLTARLLREAKILRKLSHPGVVRLVDSGSVHGILYLAMERIEGKSLGTIMKLGPLEAEVVCSIGIKIGDTLAHLHEIGIVHRDIKPDNVIIDTQGSPILTDFGLSRLSGATAITKRDELVGSLGYIAPEIVDGAQPSPKTDQYALGRLMFNMAAGPAPDDKDTIPILEQLAKSLETDWSRYPRGGIYDSMGAIVRKMIAPKEKDRFPHMYACIVELNAALVGQPLGFDPLPRYDSVPTDKHGVVSRVMAESARAENARVAEAMRSGDDLRAEISPHPDLSEPPEPRRASGVEKNWEDDTKFNPAPDLANLVAQLAVPKAAPWLASDLSAPAALPGPVGQAPASEQHPDFSEIESAPPFAADDLISAADTNDLIVRLRQRTKSAWVAPDPSPEAGVQVAESVGPLDLLANAKTDKSAQIGLLRARTQAFWRQKLEASDREEQASQPDDAGDEGSEDDTEAMASWRTITGAQQRPVARTKTPVTAPKIAAIRDPASIVERAPVRKDSSFSLEILEPVEEYDAESTEPPEADLAAMEPRAIQAATTDVDRLPALTSPANPARTSQQGAAAVTAPANPARTSQPGAAASSDRLAQPGTPARTSQLGAPDASSALRSSQPGLSPASTSSPGMARPSSLPPRSTSSPNVARTSQPPSASTSSPNVARTSQPPSASTSSPNVARSSQPPSASTSSPNVAQPRSPSISSSNVARPSTAPTSSPNVPRLSPAQTSSPGVPKPPPSAASAPTVPAVQSIARIAQRPSDARPLAPPDVDLGDDSEPTAPEGTIPKPASWAPLIPYPAGTPPSPTLEVAADEARASREITAHAHRRRKRLLAYGAIAAVSALALVSAFIAVDHAGRSSEASLSGGGAMSADGFALVPAPASDGTRHAPIFRYLGSQPAAESNLQIATSLYGEARNALRSGELAAAERFLGLCIRAADLPDCHKALGAVAAAQQRPEARVHYQYYLEHTADPHSGDANEVRRMLDAGPR